MEESLVVMNENVPAIADDQIVKIAAEAEKRISAVKRIREISLKVTNAQDWTDQGGKPYLQVSGSEKVARLFGISWQIEEPKFEEEESGHYSYTYKGRFSLSGVTIEAIGSRSTKDPFFTKYDYAKDGTKTQKPIEAIDKGDVRKSAYTNCIGNGITRLLGIRNLTWEELAAGGITRDKTSGVQYGGKGKQQTEHQKQESQNPNLPATENQLGAIKKMLSALKTPDENYPTAVEGILGMELNTLKKLDDINRGQASDVIKALTSQLNEKKGEGK